MELTHGNVVDVDVLDNVGLAGVLTERSDGDAVRSIAPHILHKHVRTVGFEAHAVVP